MQVYGTAFESNLPLLLGGGYDFKKIARGFGEGLGVMF